MPFVNESQRRACWAKQRADEKAGRTPTWDCHAWSHEGQKKKAAQSYDQTIQKHTRSFVNSLRQIQFALVLSIIVFAVALGVAASKAVAAKNTAWPLGVSGERLDFQMGKFFEYFAAIFIPGYTLTLFLSQMLWQQSVYRPDQIIVMIVFMVFYFQGHKTDLDFTQKAFVNLYIIAVMWCFVSANRLELIVWLSSLALIVPGGLALNFQR